MGAGASVASLQQNGVEYASSGVKSGFLYRELPATVPNLVPNGSFESGSTSPTSWSFVNNSAGTWAFDTTNKTAGTRSMKVTIPGTTAKRSPMLTSGTLSVLPSTTYTLSAQMKTSGLSYSLSLFVVVQASDGTSTQLGLSSPTGTNGWALKSLKFTTQANAVSAFLKAEIYNGYGTGWLDDVQMSDAFGGRVPVAFGGSVASDSGGMTQTASASGLNLNARFTSVGTAIRVDATLTDTTGQDRPVEVSFRLPLDVVGWSWDNNFVSSSVIQDGVRYENLDYTIGKQGRSLYPFASVRNGVAAFSLAVPMGPKMQRFSYDTVNGLRSVWDLGLSAAATKTPSKASWTFWIYSQKAAWGFRAAAEKYYALNPSSFTTSVKLNGAWMLGGSASVTNFQDFGWAVEEGDGLAQITFANPNGILSYHYVDPSGWFRQFPSYTGGSQPPYNTIISALNSDAASGTGTTVDSAPVTEMAQAVINSSPYTDQQLYQVMSSYYFWYKNTYQIFPVMPDPDIPAPSMWSVLKKYSFDGRIAMWQNIGNHLDGIFLDNLSYIFASKENYRRALWAYSNVPLTFSYSTRKVTQFNGFAIAEFVQSAKSYLAGKGLGLMGSGTAADQIWVSPSLDIMGGEVQGAESSDLAYVRRTLSYGKSWSNLQVPPSGTGPPTAAQVLAYFQQALSLGYFPGFNGSYWTTPTVYERDRALFKQYMPLIKKIVAAGWRPVTYATPSNPAIYVERFDDQVGNTFYLTAHNTGYSTTSYQMTVDGASLDAGSGTITLKELLGNTTLSASRSGSNILFSDSLAPGETALYEMTTASGCDATYGDLNEDGQVDATDLVILSHYLVGNMTQGTAPFTAPLAKADLDRSGTVDAVDLVILQNYLAGNLACLPK